MSEERAAHIERASAWGSGKLILLGEHAVVYGEPALALALPRGLKVTLTLTQLNASLNAKSMIKLSCAELGDSSFGVAERAALERALERASSWMSVHAPRVSAHYTLSVTGSLPFKVGLGSSAALSVATLRALGEALKVTLSDAELAAGALEMERVFHEHPSGLDHHTSIHGGAVRYQRRDELGSTLSTIKIGAPLALALTWTPRLGSTADAVRDVATLRAAKPEYIGAILHEIGMLTSEGVNALAHGDLRGLGELLDHNHKLLRTLNVSSSLLDESCAHWKREGALGAKLSGAGRGGVSLGLFADKARAERAAQSISSPSWVVSIDAST